MTQGLLILARMEQWIARGWLSHLNRAFVRFLLNLDKDASDAVLWAGALVSHQLDRGEVYLDLEKLCRQPGLTLAIPSDEARPADREAALAELAVLQLYSLEAWQSALAQSRLVDAGEGAAPLVLDGHRLYLRRHWGYQQILDTCLQQRLQPIRDRLPESLLEQLPMLFQTSPEQPDWQKIACLLALRARFSIITGGPGTGKTTTLTKLLVLLIRLADYETPGKTLTLLLAAPTGKAAARVSESIAKALDSLAIDDSVRQTIPRKASTLHRLLGSRHDSRRFIHNRRNPLVADIVIVDEASMIDLEMMASLLEALPETTTLILLGDKDQLASVEAGSVMGDLCRGAERAAYDEAARDWIGRYAGERLETATETGDRINQQTVMLRHSHRFHVQSGIGQLARAVNDGDAQRAQSILNDADHYADLIPKPRAAYLKLRARPQAEAANRLLKQLVTAKDVTDNGYGHYLELITKQRPGDSARYEEWARRVLAAFDTFQVLCALRGGQWGVENLNRCIEGWLFPEQKNSLWYEGRPVMITRNDYNLGLMNGDIGIALRTDAGKLRVAFPNEDPLSEAKIRWVSPMRLPDVETAFAITVHKSQGSEFNHVVLVLPENRGPVITRELIYTGITRAKKNFTLLESGAEVFEQAVLATCQ